MTRERYKEYMLRRWSRNIPYMEEEMNRDIDTIFDAIESRVCKNCKHYNMDTAVYYCNKYDVVMINSDHTIKSVDENFGCNKFERKVESK